MGKTTITSEAKPKTSFNQALGAERANGPRSVSPQTLPAAVRAPWRPQTARVSPSCCRLCAAVLTPRSFAGLDLMPLVLLSLEARRPVQWGLWSGSRRADLPGRRHGAAGTAAGTAVGSSEMREKIWGPGQVSGVWGGLHYWNTERRGEGKRRFLLSKAEARCTPACRGPHLQGRWAQWRPQKLRPGPNL